VVVEPHVELTRIETDEPTDLQEGDPAFSHQALYVAGRHAQHARHDVDVDQGRD
jgi:hypothetical protein